MSTIALLYLLPGSVRSLTFDAYYLREMIFGVLHIHSTQFMKVETDSIEKNVK